MVAISSESTLHAVTAFLGKKKNISPLSPQGADGVNVGADDLSDAPGQEVPDDNAPVVAAHGEQRAPAVEGAGQGHADAVQRAIGLLRGTGSGSARKPLAAGREQGQGVWKRGRLPQGSSARRILQRNAKTAPEVENH